jgi:hypothetical protein
VTDLSIVVVSFNTSEITQRTLAALTGVRDVAIEIIVVDNGSHDDSAAAIRARFPSATVIVNPVNRYYAAANNQAIAAASGRFVLVLNSDAEPGTGTLRAMTTYMDAHPDVGCLSPLMRFPDGRVQRNCARRWTFSELALEHSIAGFVLPGRRERSRRHHWYADWDRTTEKDVDVVPGSCMMVRRDVLDRVGVFDERLRLYFAEDDWCARIRNAGFRIVYAPIGSVVHPEGASTEAVAGLARRLYFDDMIRYAAMHFGRMSAGCLWILTRPTIWAMRASAIVRKR